MRWLEQQQDRNDSSNRKTGKRTLTTCVEHQDALCGADGAEHGNDRETRDKRGEQQQHGGERQAIIMMLQGWRALLGVVGLCWEKIVVKSVSLYRN